MKHLILAAAAAALVSGLPTGASAQSSDATVCGRVNAPAMKIFDLSTKLTPLNIIYATSGTESVEGRINTDGSFCFKDLHADLHTLTAFGDSPSAFRATVMPVAGKTVFVWLSPIAPSS
jgi:hypothetical protein